MALLLLIFAAALLVVPDARALISGWFRVGVINVMPSAPTHVSPAASRPVTATPSAPTDLPLALRDLSGLTTLERARQDSGFRIGLPAYPENLPDPDLVFYQPRLDLVVLVWLDPNEPEVVRLSLFEILSSNPIVNKIDPTILAETDVNGHPALWLEGPYPLEIRTGEITWTRIVDGRSLVWESEGVTYRLESLLSLAESLKIAESVR